MCHDFCYIFKSPVPFYLISFPKSSTHSFPLQVHGFQKEALKSWYKRKPESYVWNGDKRNVCFKEKQNTITSFGTFVLSFWTEVLLSLSGSKEDYQVSQIYWGFHLDQSLDGKIIEKKKGILYKAYSFCCPYTTYTPLILPGDSKRLVWCNVEDCAQWKFSPLFFRVNTPWGQKTYGFGQWHLQDSMSGVAKGAFLVQVVPSLQSVTKFWA